MSYTATDVTASLIGLCGAYFIFQHVARKGLFPLGLSLTLLLFFFSIGVLLAPLGPLGMFAGDGAYYLNWGWSIGESLRDGEVFSDNPTESLAATRAKVVLPMLIGLLSAVLGKVTLVPILMNALSASLVVIVLTEVSRKVFGTASPTVVTSLTVTSPVFLLYSGSLYRESGFWLGLSLLLLGLIQTFSLNFRTGLVYILVGASIAISLRADFALPLVVGSVSVAIATHAFQEHGISRRIAYLGLAGLLAIFGLTIWILFFAWSPDEIMAGRRWTSRAEVDTTLQNLPRVLVPQSPGTVSHVPDLSSGVSLGWLLVLGFLLSFCINVALAAIAIMRLPKPQVKSWFGPATVFLLAIVGSLLVSGNFGLFVRLAQPALLAAIPYSAGFFAASQHVQRILR